MSIPTSTLAMFHQACCNFLQNLMIWVHLAHISITTHFKFIGAIVHKVIVDNGGLIKIDCLCNMVGFVMEDHI